MQLNKKIYKYLSIISFTVVIIMICNLILPIFTKAEENNELVMNFEEDYESGELKLTGSIPSGYAKYELYWVEGNMPFEKPEADATIEEKRDFVGKTIDWFNKNKIKDKEFFEGKSEINSVVQIKKGKTYTVLCVAYLSDDEYMIKWSSKTTTVSTKEEKNTNNDLVPNAGKDINVEICKIKGEDSTLAINATSETGNITVLKYLISNEAIDVDDDKSTKEVENEENRSKVKNGISVNLDGGESARVFISDSTIKPERYIALYVESSKGDTTYRYWKNVGKIENIQEVENAPWEESDQQAKVEANNDKKEDGEAKQEENKEENKDEDIDNNKSTNVVASRIEKINDIINKAAEEAKPENNQNSENESDAKGVENKEDIKNEEKNENKSEENTEDKAEEVKEENKEDNTKKEESAKESEVKKEEKVVETKKEEAKTEIAKTESTKASTEKNDSQKSNTNNNTNSTTKVESKETEKSTSQTKKTDTNKNNNTKVPADFDKYEELPSEGGTVDTANTKIPQTGVDNIPLIIGIVVFAAMGIISLRKYKMED